MKSVLFTSLLGMGVISVLLSFRANSLYNRVESLKADLAEARLEESKATFLLNNMKIMSDACLRELNREK